MDSRSLPDLWHDHQHATFPAFCLKRSLRDQPLVKLDAATGAILTACLGRDGVIRDLPAGKLEELRRLSGLLQDVRSESGLEGEGRDYFERLLALTKAVLKA